MSRLLARTPRARSARAGAAALLVAMLVVAIAPGSGRAAVAHPVAQEATYRVQRGDTVTSLAARFDTSIAQLVTLNGLSNPDQIIAGRSLHLPRSAAQSLGTSSMTPPSGRSVPGGRHRVVAGDTLAGIAARYGISVDDLARWNGMRPDGVLYSTTSLVLYDPGPLPPPTIVCPVPGAAFFNDWAFPRSGGRVHLGNDLFARRGTPFLAPTSGTVTTDRGAIGGLQVWLTDGDGNRWMGSHLDAFGKTGWVRAGDVIGYVGDSGNAVGSSPHVHLEYHPAGREPINPYPVLRAAC